MRYTKRIIRALPFIKCFEKEKVDFLLKLSEITQKSKGQILTKQFEQSHSFYFLISGSVNFSISLDDKNEEFSVGKSSKQFTPIGWSGFRSPNRYATTVRCEEDSVFIKWNHKNLEKFFEQEPGLGREFLLFIVKQSVDLLYQVCKQLVNYNNISSDVDFGKTAGSFGERENIIVPDATELIQKSSFFEIFPEKIVRSLSKLSEKRWYLSGDILFNQGEDTKGIDILAYGKVALCFQDKPNADIDDSTILGIVNRPGTIIGWRSLCPSLINETSAIATKDSVVYHISKKSLSKLIENNTDIAFAFAKRLLWLVSIRLRNARAGLISNSYEREILAISNLIDQNATQLSVNSRLHKLPHLLNNTLTLDDAFNLLFKIERDGNSLEKDLSVLCLDILGKVYKEYTFFEGLKHIYQSVTDAPKSLSHSEIRSMADKQFVGIFEQIPYVIKGWENLPDKPGNIFIYNHLLNHPYNTLPNDFQITLDSHFISSMILYRKYGESSIRVVRVPRADEYGHENYYDRLGHINVYTKESEILKESEFDKKIRREKFFKTAAEYVSNGINIALSPEGTSLSTDESPGHFKPGSFLLTEYIDPEPYIVPIAIANFDKRINQSVLVATIKKPFLLSEQLSSNKLNKTELNNFLSNYRDVFRGYVEEATQIALDAETKKINLKFFEKVDRDNLVIDKNLFERDIRVLEKRYKDKSKDSSVLYGSSTLRLWKNVSKLFSSHNIVNFGFGGARIDYCRYYFDRLIKSRKIKSFVFYAGDNDIGDGRLPNKVFNSFIAFYNKFREYFPEVNFTFVSIKPSPDRYKYKDRIEATNSLIKQFISNEPNTFYLNIYDEMLDDEGIVKEKLFKEDKLHLNIAGYDLWGKIFKEHEHEIFT